MFLLLGACAGTASNTESGSNNESVDAATSDITSRSQPGGEDAGFPDLTGLRVISYPALGGSRLGIEDDIVFLSEGDFMSVRDPLSDGQVIIARVSQTADGKQISNVDEFLAEVDAFSAPTVTVPGETMNLLGEQLALYQFRGDGQPGPGLFAARPFGYFGNVWWTPDGFADVFLAEIEGGVIAVGAIASTAEGLASARELLDEVVPTLALLTADTKPAALPESADRYQVTPDSLGFSPATLDPQGAPELTQLFSPVEAGDYQMGNLSVPIALSIDDGWFAAINIPTFVVFAELPPVGPGFRDIIFQQGVNAIAGVNLDHPETPSGLKLPTSEIFFLTRPTNSSSVQPIIQRPSVARMR